MSGLEAAEGASRSDNRQPRAANERLWQKAWVGGFGVASTRALPSFVICVIASSVLYIWTYNNIRGSLLVVVLFHATINLPPLALPGRPRRRSRAPFLIYVTLTAMTAAVVAAAAGPWTCPAGTGGLQDRRGIGDPRAAQARVARWRSVAAPAAA